MLTVTGTGVLSGSDTDDGAENVPSLPAQLIENGIASLGPVVRVNVIVRSPFSPASHPSRSKMLTPSLGVASQPLTACLTAALLVIVIGTLVVSIAFKASHAPAMLTTPF